MFNHSKSEVCGYHGSLERFIEKLQNANFIPLYMPSGP